MVKRNGFRPRWLSAYAGSNPVPRIFLISFEKYLSHDSRCSKNVVFWHESPCSSIPVLRILFIEIEAKGAIIFDCCLSVSSQSLWWDAKNFFDS